MVTKYYNVSETKTLFKVLIMYFVYVVASLMLIYVFTSFSLKQVCVFLLYIFVTLNLVVDIVLIVIQQYYQEKVKPIFEI